MAVQPGLCRTWSETPKTGFLTTRLILSAITGSTTRADENTYYDYDKEQKIPTYLLWDYLIEAYADKYEKMYQEFQVRALCVRNYDYKLDSTGIILVCLAPKYY